MKITIMKSLLLLFTLITMGEPIYSQSSNTAPIKMKLNAGIVTEKLGITKKFYTEILGFTMKYENEFYLLMQTPDHSAELSFLLPHHKSQRPIFQAPFTGQGMYLTIEVENVDEVYREIQNKDVHIEVRIRDEAWGDRHFAIKDPNGIAIDIVSYRAPSEEK